MFVSNVGGIIAAASKESAHPLRKTGKIPAIKRIVLSMQQAGLFPIVVVVGADDYESRYQLNNLNVVFLILEESDEKRELFHSVKAGLSYLQDKCLSVVFTPVNAPMFIPKTIVEMRKYHDDIVVPSYKKKAGHPVLISNEMIPDILAYDGENGLRGAIEKYAGRRILEYYHLIRRMMNCKAGLKNIINPSFIQSLLLELDTKPRSSMPV